MNHNNCPNSSCNRRLTYSNQRAGRHVQCPDCNEVASLPIAKPESIPATAGDSWGDMINEAFDEQVATKANEAPTELKARRALPKWAWALGCGVAVCLLIGGGVFTLNRIGKKSRAVGEPATQNPTVEVARANPAPRPLPKTTQPTMDRPAKAPAAPKAPGVPSPKKEIEANRAFAKVIDQPKAATVIPALAPKKDMLPKTTRNWYEQVKSGVAIVQGKRGHGTGFLIGPRLLATNSHVIDGELGAELRVRFLTLEDPIGQERSVRVVHDDRTRDLALLELLGPVPKQTIVKLVSNERLKEGLDVAVIGHPGNGDGTISVLTRTDGKLLEAALFNGESYYKLSAAARPGNSGGPVIDTATGEVVGVVTRARSDKTESMCIPAAFVEMAVRDLGDGDQRERYASEAAARHNFAFSFRFLSRTAAAGKKIIDLRDDLQYREKSKGSQPKEPTVIVDGRRMNAREFFKFIAEKYKEEMGPYRPDIIKTLDDPLIPYSMRERLKELARINRDMWKRVEFPKIPIETTGTANEMMEQFRKVAEALRKDLNLPE